MRYRSETVPELVFFFKSKKRQEHLILPPVFPVRSRFIPAQFFDRNWNMEYYSWNINTNLIIQAASDIKT